VKTKMTRKTWPSKKESDVFSKKFGCMQKVKKVDAWPLEYQQLEIKFAGKKVSTRVLAAYCCTCGQRLPRKKK